MAGADRAELGRMLCAQTKSAILIEERVLLLYRQGWRLVLTGHSLGACCALLALKLRAQYPNLHCWAYGPPGGFCTLPLARAMRAFCTSVIVGKVGRLQLPGLKTSRVTYIPLYMHAVH